MSRPAAPAGQPARTRFAPATTGVIGALNCEWVRLSAHATRTDGVSWSDEHPALTGMETLGDVREALSRARSGPRTDAILHALLELHAQGRPYAGRTVLQSMLGKSVRLARTASQRLLLDPQECALAAMWATIDRYPLHRRTSVAGNLALDALKMLEGPGLTVYPCEPDRLGEHLEHARECHRLDDGQDRDHDTVVETLMWALETARLTRSEVQLLARLHLADDAPDISLREVANELGLTYEATRQRYSRALRRLAAGVAQTLGAGRL